MTRLALVRHGQTDWNAARRIQGRTDIPLDDTGREQARVAADALRDGGWDRIVSSGLQRADETARIIATELGLGQPRTDDRLQEREYGVGEGMPILTFRTQYPHDAVVPGAESDAQVTERALAALAQIAEHEPDVPTIVVTHGGVIRMLINRVSNGALPPAGVPIANASVTVFDASGPDLVLVSDDVPWVMATHAS